jgi:hypothetical protein
MNETRDWVIEARTFEAGRGWCTETIRVAKASYERAGREASRIACELDAKYGNDHLWTVDLKGEHGSYFQLFHGRTS